MLCDDLIQSAEAGGTRFQGCELDYQRRIARMVRDAERFRLDHEAVDVVLDVQETKPSSIMAGSGICRLPHQKVWIEFDLKYRMDALARYGYIPDYPAYLKNIQRGVLLVASDDTYRRGVMYIVVRQNGIRPMVNPFCMGFDFSRLDENESYRHRQRLGDVSSASKLSLDMYSLKDDDYSVRFKNQPAELDALAHMENIFLRLVDEMAHNWLLDVQINRGRDVLNELTKFYQEDYSGEPRFVLGIMMLLNSRNLVEYEECSVRDKNRARGPRDGRAVVSHRTVKIKLSKVSKNRMLAQGMSAAEIALHKVRGHWKVRKTGVFFWRPHERGSRIVGIADHDYLVTG
jgi:hypothetical protein